MDFYLSIRDDKDLTQVSHQNRWERTPNTESIDKTQAAEQIGLLNKRSTGVLPPVVRYLSPTGHHVMLERPPQVVTYRYYGKPKGDIDENTTLQEMDIALPWTLYAIGLDNNFNPYMTYVYALQQSIRYMDDPVGLLPLTNCELDGKFCTPSSGEAPKKAESIADGVNIAYQNIWSSNFNTDIVSIINRSYRNRAPRAIFDGKGDRGAMPKNAPHKPSNFFKRWEEFTLQEVLQWRDWLPAAIGESTVQDVLSLLQSGEVQFDARQMYNQIRQSVI